MLLTRFPRRLERFTSCVADGTHVEQILRRHLEARSVTKLVDAPRNLNVSYNAPSPGSRKYFLRSISENMPTTRDQLKTALFSSSLGVISSLS